MILAIVLIGTAVLVSLVLANSVFKTFNKNLDKGIDGLNNVHDRLKIKEAELKRKKGKV